MAEYLAASFGEPVQRAELTDPRHVVFFAERDGETVGYAMLRLGPAPEQVRSSDPIEIARLYSVSRWIGAGVGAALMQRCLDEAAVRGNSIIWLGVWERNARAIAFYRRWGFTDVGAQTFTLGHDVQTDRIMARRVGGEA
jgi:GNAT superfamily N-acetyltransferase